MVVIVLLVANMVLRLIIGISLFISARRNNLINLYWLSALFLISFISQLFSPAFSGSPLASLPISIFIQNGAIIPGGFLIIAFIHSTFYVNKPSPVLEMTALHIMLSAIGLYGIIISPSPDKISRLTASLSVSLIVIWSWHFIISRNAYNAVATDASVGDWIKTRYKRMIAYTILTVISNAAISILWVVSAGNVNSALGGLLGLIALAATIVAVILQFLVWGAPESTLALHQRRRKDEETQQTASTIMQAVSAAISANSEISPMVAAYTLRTAIANFNGVGDSGDIEAQALKMGFDDWRKLLGSPEFEKMIAPLATRRNAAEALQGARQALLDRQSLFTMRAK
ncbi:MAG: hypothetical protein LC099_01885 [Anaerolineales bacterium]|nr:hypothetical protein [Anaerolineales bacterium]